MTQASTPSLMLLFSPAAFLLLRGSKTLALRVDRQSATAAALAAAPVRVRLGHWLHACTCS